MAWCKNLDTYNVVTVHTREYASIARDVWKTPGMYNKWMFVFGRPGWSLKSILLQNYEAYPRRSLETRQLILQTARTLFAHKGFDSTSTTDIAEQSSVTRGALYHQLQKQRGFASGDYNYL